jgi:tetratricopeptide (TPR) repeat protein
VIENGTVLIRDGRIVAVGANVTVPSDARRIDATGKWVTPGIFNATTSVGISEVGAVQATVDVSARGQNDLAAREWRRALVIDPKHDAAKEALANTGTEERIVIVAATKPAKPVHTAAVVTKSPAVATAPAPASPKSLELEQSSFDLLQRARNASERGKMTEAVENYRRVLSREGGYFPPANLELSYVLVSLKRYDEALANLLEVSKRDGARDPNRYYDLARVYERNGDLKLAEAAFSQAAPTNAQFLLDLSRVREKLGDYKGSLEAMENYLKLMQDQGQKPTWSDQRLAELRTKAAKQ